MVNICFLSGSLEFGDVQGKVRLHDQCPIKTRALSLTSVLFLHLAAGAVNHVLCISVGRRLLEACVWFPPVFAPCLLSLCLFCFGGLPGWLGGKESACWHRRHRSCGFHPWVRKIRWRRKWQSTPVFLPGKSHGQSLAGYSPWGQKELDTTEWLSTYFALDPSTVMNHSHETTIGWVLSYSSHSPNLEVVFGSIITVPWT